MQRKRPQHKHKRRSNDVAALSAPKQKQKQQDDRPHPAAGAGGEGGAGKAPERHKKETSQKQMPQNAMINTRKRKHAVDACMNGATPSVDAGQAEAAPADECKSMCRTTVSRARARTSGNKTPWGDVDKKHEPLPWYPKFGLAGGGNTRATSEVCSCISLTKLLHEARQQTNEMT